MCVILHGHNEYPSVENVSAESTIDPVAILTNFFKLCNTPEFLEYPPIMNLLEAQSGQHLESMFYCIVSDKDIPRSLWQLTVGEDLYPNIYMERPKK